jgi:hypothetical protein
MNNIFKKWLDKQPPLSVNPLHNGQYYLTDEQALDFAKMYSSEKLRLPNVVSSFTGKEKTAFLIGYQKGIKAKGVDVLNKDK